MYHYQDYIKLHACKRQYLLSRTEHQKSQYFAFANMKVSPEESLIRKLKIDSFYHGKVGDDMDVFKRVKDSYHWFINMRFSYRGMRIKMPFLCHEQDRWIGYFLSYSPNPSNDLAKQYSMMIQVLEKCGVHLDEYYLIRLNMNYVREDELDDDLAWIVGDSFVNGHGTPTKTLVECIEESTLNLDEMINELDRVDESIIPEPEYVSACHGRGQCDYYENCFPEYSNLPDNSIFMMNGLAKKDELYHAGITTLKDVSKEDITLTRLQYAQVMADINGGFFVDKIALSKWLEPVQSNPAIFLDFEWDLHLLPPYKGMHPLQPLINQYSIHILDHGNVTHLDYLGEKDCRKELVEHLIHDIPKDGHIFAFNATGAEQIRIQELAEYYPEYAKELNGLLDRLYDLQQPFAFGLLYDLRMRGSHSLKTLTNIIDQDHSYLELDVSEGLEAVAVHREYELCTDEMRKKQLEKDLKEYCAMDTKELMKLYRWLLQICR